MRAILLAAVTLLLACGVSDADRNAVDTLTQRQRDSVVGASGLPGARGVQRALEVADSASARNRRLDSLRRE